MRGNNSHVADSVVANTFLQAVGATVDAEATLTYIQRKVGQMMVAEAGSAERAASLFGTAWCEGKSVGWRHVDRVSVDDLRNLSEGRFYFIFRESVIRGRSFYVGDEFAKSIAVNAFARLRGTFHPGAGTAPVLRDRVRKGRDRHAGSNRRPAAGGHVSAPLASQASQGHLQCIRTGAVTRIRGHLGVPILLGPCAMVEERSLTDPAVAGQFADFSPEVRDVDAEVGRRNRIGQPGHFHRNICAAGTAWTIGMRLPLRHPPGSVCSPMT